MIRNRAVLTVDLEFFEHTPAYRRAQGEMNARSVGLDGVKVLRAALAERNAKATFFVVSEVATRHPGTVCALTDDGHEVGSHTHSHRLLSTLDRDDRREELSASRDVLGRVTGGDIRGFRSPAFEIPDGHFETVSAAGYRYDSSVAPCRRIPGWYGGEHEARRPVPATSVSPDAPEDIVELPVGVIPGLRLPITGAWLRFFGPRYTLLGMRLLAREGIAPVLYVHPWEFVDLPPVEGVPKRVYWRTGAWMRRAVERILDAPFEFVTAASEVDRA